MYFMFFFHVEYVIFILSLKCEYKGISGRIDFGVFWITK